MASSGSEDFKPQSSLESEASVGQKESGWEVSEDTDDRGRKSQPEKTRESRPSAVRNKRKRASSYWESAEARAKAKRLRGSYSTAYNDLFNSEVTDAASGLDTFPPKRYQWTDSTFGLTSWSTKEKDRFFDALDKHGKANVKAVAVAVGSKSEPEVQAYIHLLHGSLLEQEFGDRHSLAEYAEIPAACQVSEECDTTLEESADALAHKQFEHDVDVEKRKHGELWLLNLEAVEKLEEQQALPDFKVNTGDENSRSQLDKAFELLDLRTFVELSFTLFMNSENPECNWKSYADHGEGPSIFCTASLDLYSLVVGITKRLVSSCLFMAMSRRRALEARNGSPGKAEVQAEDAEAAIEVLGFKHDRLKYWTRAGRRCNVKVYDGHKRDKAGREELSHSEVERRLMQSFKDRSNSSDHPPLDAQEGYSSEVSTSVVGSPPPLSANEGELELQQAVQELQDDRAEYHDMKSGWEEELRLWSMLEMDPKGKAPALLDTSPPKRQLNRKSKEDLADWREKLLYRSEWETLDGLPDQSAFERNRKRRRRRREENSDGASSEVSVGEELENEVSQSKHPSENSGNDLSFDGTEDVDLEDKGAERRFILEHEDRDFDEEERGSLASETRSGRPRTYSIQDMSNQK